jgi:ABC-2 type transport system permease protein
VLIKESKGDIMNILNIMWKEIKQNLRDRKAMCMMVLFPIVLILILGTALAGNFDNSNAFKGTSVIYSVNGSGELAQGFKGLINNEKELGIKFTEAKNENEGLDEVKNSNYSAFIIVDANANDIKLYKNSKFNFNGSFIESVLNTFVQKYNVMIEIAKVNPTALGKINSDTMSNFINEVSLVEKRQPKAIDYYAVSMLTLILMYAASTSAASINGEKRTKTGSRILTAPVKKYEVLIGRILGDVLITSLQAAIVLIVSKYAVKAYWGQSGAMLPIIAVIFSEIIMAVSIGAGIAFSIKNEQLSYGLINTTIPFLVFLGGGYIPLDQFNNPVLNTICKISPIKWINDAIFEIIYNNNFSIVPKTLIITFTIAIIFIAASAMIFRKEAA